MSNEKRVEEIMMQAHQKGYVDEILEMVKGLVSKGTERYKAFEMAHHQIKENEVHDRRHKG